MNNEEHYQLFSIDFEAKRIFITNKPIIPANEFEIKKRKIDINIETRDFMNYKAKKDRTPLSEFEIVDISEWQYETLGDLDYLMYSYESEHKKR